MATMRDVAVRAGVSAKTVSRVINRDRYVSDEVRVRVERAIDELRYVPNMLAVTFRNGKDAAIGVAVPSVADPFFGGIVEAVEREASQRGVATIVTTVGFGGEHEQRNLEALLQRQVIGMIIVPVGDVSYLRSWQERTPMVFVDRPAPRLTADSVVQDDRGGAAEAIRHLLAHGHRRIGFLGDDETVPTARLRLEGYREALVSAGLAYDPSLVYLGETDEVSVTAFLEGRLERMGVLAVQRLFARIEEPGRRLRRRTVLPVELRTRGSCGMPGEKLRAGHADPTVPEPSVPVHQ